MGERLRTGAGLLAGAPNSPEPCVLLFGLRLRGLLWGRRQETDLLRLQPAFETGAEGLHHGNFLF